MTAGCTDTPTVKTDYDQTVDYAKYHQYSWVYTGVPQGMNPLLFDRVRGSIDRSLAARGYQPVEKGDFAIAFTLGRRDRVEVTDFGPYGPYYRGWGWGAGYRNVDVRNVTDGTLVIDLYDVATRKPIWHGVATQEIDPGKVDQAKIDTAIDAVLAKFPPQPGAQ
ncbi:DUF4136 domain-containing protein [Sphingomonas sp. KR3-1]|uniref:DUF4136 domain-containing protein n=1 Tax=Sphingomonas sp. KR3-1 TaxID=3156611 RepID=UPI0032B4FB94